MVIGRGCLTDRLNCFVSIIVHYLYTRIFTQAFNIKLLVLVQEALFPDGYPAPSVPDPTAEEQIMIKERALRALADALPGESVEV